MSSLDRRDKAKKKWLRKFKKKLDKLVENIGNTEAYVSGVAQYLGVDESEITESEEGQSVIQSFEDGCDVSREEMDELIIQAAPNADSLDDALDELADKWDTNYLHSFTGRGRYESDIEDSTDRSKQTDSSTEQLDIETSSDINVELMGKLHKWSNDPDSSIEIEGHKVTGDVCEVRDKMLEYISTLEQE